VLGPEMRSTGEVMGWDRTFALAFLKAQMGAGMILPTEGRAFISIKDMDKTDALAAAARDLVGMGFEVVATKGTAAWLARHGVAATPVSKVYEGRPNIVDRLKNNDIALVMNTTEGTQAISDSRDIRRVALMDKIPYFTTAAASIAAGTAMKARGEGYGVRTLQG
jgi:carbamoyl-phosphate synthase large subunit